MLGFERLTARNKNGFAYLVNVKPNEQEVDSPHKNTLKCILDCFERLAQYEEEAIARQSVTSEEVAEAIETLKNENGFTNGKWYRAVDLAITALQEYQKPKPDCESAEKWGDKCCGYGKSEYDDEPIDVCKDCAWHCGAERAEG